MTTFNELLQKINEIPNGFVEDIENSLKSALDFLAEFETDYISSKTKARELNQKAKAQTTLQSIHEDEDESNKTPKTEKISRAGSLQSIKSTDALDEINHNEKPQRLSQKRSKDMVEDMSSPEQDKRPKRNASVKAKSVITKQVNVNLTQKMRRDEQPQAEKDSSSRRRRNRGSEHDKENVLPVVQIKQEKVSLPPSEAMDCDSAPSPPLLGRPEDAMPPPAMPPPKSRGRQTKDKVVVKSEPEEARRSTRARKPTEAANAQESSRSLRASSRASSRANSRKNSLPRDAEAALPPPDARPKRTRAKKKVSEPPQPEPEKEPVDESAPEPAPAATPEKPRPKRTRRGKNAEKQKSEETPKKSPVIKKEVERISEPVAPSPILQRDKINISTISKDKTIASSTEKPVDQNATVTISMDMNSTVILPNGKYEHAQSTPKSVHVNETVVLESNNRDTFVLDKPPSKIADTTVVIETAAKTSILTEDDSLLTNDDSQEPRTPPQTQPQEPKSAVKEKVQKFEELASGTTKTKTRAMINKDDVSKQTPPDKVSKILSTDTLTKMNSLIFNGKPTAPISSSASKPKANVPTNLKTVSSSSSKITTINRLREEELAKEREDARSKKEALLEARREQQKRKREEKMAAAAAAREQAERERRMALEAAQRDKEEKQQHADMGRAERMKEAERRKQEQARKALETEERRRAEEKARQARLAEEQRKNDALRKRQQHEAQVMKKEAVQMAREIEKRQKEYLEKQKMKQKIEADKIATPVKALYAQMDPVHMKDGFEYLNSDEDEDDKPSMPPVAWSTSKARWQQLQIQSFVKQSHIDRLFSVRVHSPDLREIFPEIDRRALKRTSSAVWRTPERMPVVKE